MSSMKLASILFEGKRASSVWYHTTSPENAESILNNGLRINPTAKGKSQGSLDWMPEAYGGIVPIFLSKDKGRYTNGVVLEVDVSGLGLVADIPGLIDFGGQLSDDNVDVIWFDEESTPEPFWDIVDPSTGEVEFSELRTPGSRAAKAAIKVTGTCAVMENISLDRIKVVGKV